jgi:hypothetical protein
MNLHLTPDTLTRDIKKVFTQRFPYLRLQFFHRKNDILETRFIKGVARSTRLSDLAADFTPGELRIDSHQTVADVEWNFQSMFHLSVKVYRKTRFNWTETTRSNELSLEKQNWTGKKACGGMYDLSALL